MNAKCINCKHRKKSGFVSRSLKKKIQDLELQESADAYSLEILIDSLNLPKESKYDSIVELFDKLKAEIKRLKNQVEYYKTPKEQRDYIS